MSLNHQMILDADVTQCPLIPEPSLSPYHETRVDVSLAELLAVGVVDAGGERARHLAPRARRHAVLGRAARRRGRGKAHAQGHEEGQKALLQRGHFQSFKLDE